MIKFVHLADLHLGKEWHGIDRTHDVINCFQQVIDFIKQEKIPLVLIAGDIFENRIPSGEALEQFSSQIKCLLEMKVKIVIITGNHDWNKLQETFSTIASTNPYLNIFTRFNSHNPVIQLNEPQIQIIPFPYPERGKLEGEIYQNHGSVNIHQQVSKLYGEYLKKCHQYLDESKPSILLAHIGVEGGLLSSERKMTLGFEPLLSLTDLPPFTAYNAFGHLHRKQQINCNAPTYYSGSLERLDFSDKYDDKGFYYVEIDSQATRVEFIKVKSSLMYEVSVNSSDDLDLLLSGLPEINKAYLKLKLYLKKSDSLILATERANQYSPKLLVIEPNISEEESNLDSTQLLYLDDPVSIFNNYLKEMDMEVNYREILLSRLTSIIKEIEEDDSPKT